MESSGIELVTFHYKIESQYIARILRFSPPERLHMPDK
jgi:hypothetical protein